ncbi:MAG: hypothetical protein ILP17_12315 [Lachnospiraceae bacterium]|nr:hypothetical protein [Lachnospiraceae bacterium]
MDTFMDQLSQKLNAQQIIRANGEAESEAMGVMRAQVREYQECLDRMKTVADELGGLQQTIAALPDLSAGVNDSALEGLKEEMVSMNKANEDHLQKLQSDLLAGQDAFLANQRDFAQSQRDLAQSQSELMSRQSEMLESRSNELREQIEAIKLSNEEHLEKIRNDIAESGNDDLKERLDLLEEQIGSQLGELKQAVSLQIDAIRTSNDERFERIGSDIAGNNNDEIDARLDRLEALIGEQLTSLRQDVSTEMEIRLDDLKQGMGSDMDTRFADLKQGVGADMDTRFAGLPANDNEELNTRIDRLEALIGEQFAALPVNDNTELNARLDRLEAQIGSQLGDLKQGVNADLVSGIGSLRQDVNEDLSAGLDLLNQDVSARFDSAKSVNEESLEKLKADLQALISESSSDSDIIERVEVLRDEVSAMKLQMDNMRTNSDQYLQTMQSNLRKGQEQMLQSQNSISQALNGADIHKECVRVYRNVQASIQDENGKLLDGIRQENSVQLESMRTDTSRHITVIKDESAKLLGSLRNDSSKQLEGLREENSKFLVSVKSETSKIDEQVKGVRKLALIALIASIISIAAPFIAKFL